MDDIRSLENQIRKLQQDLDSQNREMNRMRQQSADETRRKIDEYDQQMRMELKRHDKASQKEYEKLLKEYQNNLNSDVQDSQLQMNSEYRKLKSSVSDKEREWQEKNRQLDGMVSELKKSTAQKEDVGDKEIQKYIEEVNQARIEVEKKPHEKFFPRRINSFRTAITDASEMSKMGLREAAIAIFISARSGLNRLGFDVDEKYAEWTRQYEILKSKLELMDMKLADECSEWQKHALEVDKEYDTMSDAEKAQAVISITYWSSGEYSTAVSRVAELKAAVSEISNLGPMEYLKREDSMDIDALKAINAELDDMSEKWEQTAAVYKERYNAACERADWGENIIDFLEGEINLSWNEAESHFKYADAATADNEQYQAYMGMQYGDTYEKEDTRQWLELVFTNSMDTVVFVYIVPYEKGTKVENRIVLYIDYNGAENEEYSRHIYQHICESINLETDDGTINFTTDVAQLRTNVNNTLRETGQSIEKKMRRMR